MICRHLATSGSECTCKIVCTAQLDSVSAASSIRVPCWLVLILCSYGCTSSGKEVPIEYLENTLVLEYPTQVLEIAIVDRYSIKIDLEVRTVYKTKD